MMKWTSDKPENASFTPSGLLVGESPGPVVITYAYTGPAPAPTFTPPNMTVNMVAASSTHTVTLLEKLYAGNKTISIQAPKDDVISIYQIDSTEATLVCDAKTRQNATLLYNVASPTTTANTFIPVSSTPNSVTLVAPLIAGTQICLADDPPDGSGTVFSQAAKDVNDPGDFGRFRATFTSGVVVSNQQSAVNSSSAGEYLDVTFDYSWARVHMTGDHYHRTPGFDTFFIGRLSPTPVATTAVDTTKMVTPGNTATTLNLLSSQQSVHIVVGGYLPFVTTRWYNHSNVFTIAPVAKAGFDTLLNPSINGTAASVGSSSTPLSTNFSSVYSSYAGGLRLAWEQYPADSNKSPVTWVEVKGMLGQYSNLPSYACVAATAGGPPPSPALSACGTGAYTATPNISRVLIPRLELESKATFPSYPFVLGLDANLAQYTFGRHSGQIDYLNKAGNDVRVYIGITFNLLSAINKLNVGAF